MPSLSASPPLGFAVPSAGSDSHWDLPKIFRQRTPKGIWSSFARRENLSSDSRSPEVRDLIMLIMISASTAPNVISFVIS